MTREEEIGALMIRLLAACKGAVHVEANQHRNYYESAAEYIASRDPDESQDIIDEMVKTDTVIEVQCYPRTPVGFVLVMHHDLLEALREAVKGAENYSAPASAP